MVSCPLASGFGSCGKGQGEQAAWPRSQGAIENAIQEQQGNARDMVAPLIEGIDKVFGGSSWAIDAKFGGDPFEFTKESYDSWDSLSWGEEEFETKFLSAGKKLLAEDIRFTFQVKYLFRLESVMAAVANTLGLMHEMKDIDARMLQDDVAVGLISFKEKVCEFSTLIKQMREHSIDPKLLFHGPELKAEDTRTQPVVFTALNGKIDNAEELFTVLLDGSVKIMTKLNATWKDDLSAIASQFTKFMQWFSPALNPHRLAAESEVRARLNSCGVRGEMIGGSKGGGGKGARGYV